jgi:hypothetical protein
MMTIEECQEFYARETKFAAKLKAGSLLSAATRALGANSGVRVPGRKERERTAVRKARKGKRV